MVIGNTIQAPQENAAYNVEKDQYYDSIQEAIDDAGDGNTIFVGPGTYEGNLAIPNNKNNLALKGANAGIPAGLEPGERAPRASSRAASAWVPAKEKAVDAVNPMAPEVRAVPVDPAEAREEL